MTRSEHGQLRSNISNVQSREPALFTPEECLAADQVLKLSRGGMPSKAYAQRVPLHHLSYWGVCQHNQRRTFVPTKQCNRVSSKTACSQRDTICCCCRNCQSTSLHIRVTRLPYTTPMQNFLHFFLLLTITPWPSSFLLDSGALCTAIVLGERLLPGI